MKHNLTDTYDNIFLKPMDETGSEQFRLLRNREENRRWFVYSEPISQEAQTAWFSKYLQSEGEYMFSAHYQGQPDQLIGAVSIYGIDETKKQGEFGRIVVDKQLVLEKGMGTKIGTCVCQIAFEQIHLDKLVLEVFEDNIAAIRTYEKIGFKKTGTISSEDAVLITMELSKEEFQGK